jgi:succinyl-CoA synthetase alpha subunit
MFLKTFINKNIFRDSVYLMRLSSMIRGLDGVAGAEVIIGTDHNKKFLQVGGLWADELEAATASDLIIAVRTEDEQKADEAVARVLVELNKDVARENLQGDFVPRTFETARKQMPEVNLALISLPGRYVEREVNEILDAGLHVMIFSDNVSLEAEVAMKQKALEKGLLVMGPDCGTAIINGVPLAFANEVRHGSIGIVAAAGTGLQEVSAQIHNLGEGISHGIGTGGRDIKGAVGGIMMIQGLNALIADPATDVIVIVSKPPEQSVANKILAIAKESPKPVVINFVGSDPESIRNSGCEPAVTLKEAAWKAVAMLRKEPLTDAVFPDIKEEALVEKRKLSATQRYLRGVFSGGTLAYETIAILKDALDGIYTNLSFEGGLPLQDVYKSQGHTIIDFGEDEFTQGRLHPMIDPSLRNQRIVGEAGDPETAVIMFDLVLGYNAHPDPAGEAVQAIREAKAIASAAGRHLIFISSVCGTGDDLQNRDQQVEKLRAENVRVLPSNADAAYWVKEIMSGVL